MVTATVKVRFDNLPKFKKVAEIRTKRAAEEFADGVLRDMRSFVPIKTGALRDSLAVKPSAGFLAGSIFHVAIIAGQPYWIFVEHGTSRMEARPFIAPALVMNMGAFRERMARAVADACVDLSAATYGGTVALDW